jgi:hypothetical protein
MLYKNCPKFIDYNYRCDGKCPDKKEIKEIKIDKKELTKNK